MSDEVVAPDATAIARNKLATRALLADYLAPFVPDCPWIGSGETATAHIEHTLGWRRPASLVRSLDELSALPAQSVVRSEFRWDSWDDAVETIAQRDMPSSDGKGRWCFPGIHSSFDDAELWEQSEVEITLLRESGDPR